MRTRFHAQARSDVPRPLAEIRPKAPESMLSFGDGDHRCPGAYVALRETDIFLRKALAIPTLKIEREPNLSFNTVVRGYELRKMIVSV
jgi:cytochrome P450